MINVSAFKNLLGKKLNRAFLIVWPPFGEESKLDINISFGFELSESKGELVAISTSKDDNWTPTIELFELGEMFEWSLFEKRSNDWMMTSLDADIKNEYYDITNIKMFEGVLSKPILNIELLSLDDKLSAFGVKITFEDDYIFSFPNSDGNTIETKLFNRLKNIDNFSKLGQVNFIKL